MQLTIFNGSPRGKNSNTRKLMEQFASGFTAAGDNSIELVYLNQIKKTPRHVELFKAADIVILAFPLYTDAMPGIVKHFIEALEPLSGQQDNPRLGFVVQSGFPEPIHSRHIAKYLDKLAARLECHHSGTVIRGGVEGIQIMPPWMTKKLFKRFRQLGTEYAAAGRFDLEIIEKLAPRDHLSRGRQIITRIMISAGLANFYWNSNLKKNQAYKNRFAKPYAE